MLDCSATWLEDHDKPKGFVSAATDLEWIIQRCGILPTGIIDSAPLKLFERRLTRDELGRLTSAQSLENSDLENLQRLQLRRRALIPYLGSELTCVVIRLPGVRYTIEVDLAARTVAHWECQPA